MHLCALRRCLGCLESGLLRFELACTYHDKWALGIVILCNKFLLVVRCLLCIHAANPKGVRHLLCAPLVVSGQHHHPDRVLF